MPWLVGTAFLHSVMVQEKRKMFKVWNLFLVILTFSLSLIGTFLVRSGVLTSVHSFAADPERGVFILLFLAVVMGTAFGTLMVRAPKLKSQIQLDSVVSRESVFLFNNLFFLVAAATVFLGTLYPLMIETWKGSKVTVGPPYYNAVFMPIALGLLFLMGIGPYIAWRKASIDNLKKNFLTPLIIATAATLAAFGLGFRSPFSLAGAFVVGFVATTIAVDVGKVFAGYPEPAGIVEEAGRQNRGGDRKSPRAGGVDCRDLEVPGRRGSDRDDFRPRHDANAEFLRNGAVVSERLDAGGMSVGNAEGNTGDVKEVTRREPAHFLGEVVDRVQDVSPVVADRRDPPIPELDRAGDTGRSGADDCNGIHGEILRLGKAGSGLPAET